MNIWRDSRYALRGLRRSPAFAFTVISTIALGIGVNAALFTLFDAFYLRPIAVRESHSLYEFYWLNRQGDAQDFTWNEYRDFVKRNPMLSEALAYHREDARVDGHHWSGIVVDGGYFSMLGVRAALGRTLVPEDAAAPGKAPVIVLSYAVWQSQFAAAPDIVGKKILLRGYPFEVVGVAPADFTGLGKRPTDFWAPITMSAALNPASNIFGPTSPRVLGIVGRLKPGVSVRQAESSVTSWLQDVTAGNPKQEQAMIALSVSRATLQSFSPKNVGVFSLVMAAFAVILLIACANVINIMLARAIVRQREIGIRLSLGAARGRLVQQLLTESLITVLPAAFMGVVLSEGIVKLCLRVLLTTLPPGISGITSRIPHLATDIRVLAFSLAAAIFSALLCGLAPALQSARTNLTFAIHGNAGADARPSRLRNALVASQITVCVLLLITAGIVVRGIGQLQTLDPTLSSKDTVEIVVEEKSRNRVLDQLKADPIVQTIAAASAAPVNRKPFIGIAPVESKNAIPADINKVSPEYFGMFEISILRGRNFTADESRPGSPVAVISQSVAEQLWPSQNAIGHSLRIVPDRSTPAEFQRYQTVTVVGVARDELSRWASNGDGKSVVYFPSSPQAAGNELFLEVRGDAELARRQLDASLSAVDPNAISEIQTLQIRRFVSEERYSFQVMFWMSAALGILALLLTLSGIYGVVSFVVSQRTKEIGIRMALGATTRAVTALVLRQSMRLAVIGAGIGAVLAIAVSKVVASSLVMIHAFDVAAYLGAIALVWMGCAAAGYFPARRAARIDPSSTLREE